MKKSQSTSSKQDSHIDTSSQVHNYQKETVITEKLSIPFVLKADSTATSGNISTTDTTEHVQMSESNGISLKTSIKPEMKDGKITGYNIKSKAITLPHIIDVPMDRTTEIKEAGSDHNQTAIIHTKKEDIKVATKERTGMNQILMLILIACGIVGSIWIFLKFIKR